MYTEVWMLILLVILFACVFIARYFAQREPEKTEKAYAIRRGDDSKIVFQVDYHRYAFVVDPEIYEKIPLEVNGQLTFKGDQFVRFKGDEFDFQNKTEEKAE